MPMIQSEWPRYHSNQDMHVTYISKLMSSCELGGLYIHQIADSGVPGLCEQASSLSPYRARSAEIWDNLKTSLGSTTRLDPMQWTELA